MVSQSRLVSPPQPNSTNTNVESCKFKITPSIEYILSSSSITTNYLPFFYYEIVSTDYYPYIKTYEPQKHIERNYYKTTNHQLVFFPCPLNLNTNVIKDLLSDFDSSSKKSYTIFSLIPPISTPLNQPTNYLFGFSIHHSFFPGSPSNHCFTHYPYGKQIDHNEEFYDPSVDSNLEDFLLILNSGICIGSTIILLNQYQLFSCFSTIYASKYSDQFKTDFEGISPYFYNPWSTNLQYQIDFLSQRIEQNLHKKYILPFLYLDLNTYSKNKKVVHDFLPSYYKMVVLRTGNSNS